MGANLTDKQKQMSNHKRNAVRVGVIAGIVLSGSLMAGCGLFQPKSAGPKLAPPRAVNRYVEGAELLQQGRRDQAVEALRSAIESNPDLISPRSLLGEVYREDSKFKEALDQYENLVRLDPYEVSNHYYLGLCYHFLDRLQEAGLAYRDALKLNPDDFKSNMNMGLVRLALGDTEGSVAYLRKATEIDPKSAAAWLNYGVALDGAGDLARAESAYRRSLEIDATSQTAQLNFGTNLVLQGKTSEALAVLEPLAKKLNSPLVHKRFGDALAQAKRWDESAKEYEVAIKLNPRYFPAINELGTISIERYRQGLELDDNLRITALNAWKRSLGVNPDQPAIRDQVQKWEKRPLFAK
jgi:tetratricopeptide (TPR) repeat protein